MNHNNVKIIVRSFITSLIIGSGVSYGCDDHRIGSVNVENQLEDVDVVYEQHPLLVPKFKKAFIDSDQTTFPQLKDLFDKSTAVWSIHDGDRVNNECGSACLSVLRGKSIDARIPFQDATDQGSKWGAYYMGLYSLCDGDIPNLKQYLTQARQRDYFINTSAEIPYHRHLMAMVGFHAEEKCNLLSILDRMILQSSARPTGFFAYQIAQLAADNGDSDAQKMCLDEAIKGMHKFSLAAISMRAELERNKNNQQQPLAIKKDEIAKPSKTAKFKSTQPVNASDNNDISVVHDFPKSAAVESRKKAPVNVNANEQKAAPQIINDKQKAKELETSLVRPAITAGKPQETVAMTKKSADSQAKKLLNVAHPEKTVIINAPSPTQSSLRIIPSATSSPIVSSQEAVITTEKSTIKEIDFAKLSEKQLLQKKNEISKSLLRTTNDASLRKDFFLVCEALLEKEIDNSQRIAIWREMSEKRDIKASFDLGTYYIDNNKNDASRISQGFDLLKFAADNNHGGACFAFITKGLQSTDNAKKETAAYYADRLFNDPVRMADLALDDAQKGDLYAERARYASEKADKKTAREYFKKASECGNHKDAYTLATLFAENNEWIEARKEFGLVQDDYPQAKWKSMVLDYAMDNKSSGDKSILLQEIIKPFCGETFYGSVITNADMELILKNEDVKTALQNDSNQGLEEATCVLLYCMSKKLMTAGTRPLSQVIVEYGKRGISQAEKNGKSGCKNVCISLLRERADEGDKAAELYLRKDAPTDEQKRLDLLYQGDALDAALTLDEINELKKDAAINDPALTLHAQGLLATDYLRQASHEHKLNQQEKARALYKKAVECLRAGINQSALMLSAKIEDQKAQSRTSKMRTMLPNALTALARITKDVQEQEQLYKEAADDPENPSPYACTRMYRYTNQEHYLTKAIKGGDIEALLISTQQLFEREPQAGVVRTNVDTILGHIERDHECLSDELKAQSYLLKVKLCTEKDEKMRWRCKAVEAGDTKWAFFAVLKFIKDDAYDKARSALQKVAPDSLRAAYVPTVKKYIDYLVSPENMQKRESVLRDCICILRGAINEPLDEGAESIVYPILERINPSEQATNDVEKEVLMLDSYIKKDYKKAHELGRKLENKESPAAFCVLADMAYQGKEVRRMLAEGVAMAMQGLADEKCPTCRRHGRVQLYKMLSENDCDLKWTPEVDKTMRNIRKVLHEDKDESEAGKYIEQRAIEYLAVGAYSRQDMQELLKLYPKIRDSVHVKRMYTAVLYEHNLLEPKDKVKSVQNALQIYEQLAQEGDPAAQQYLTSIYCDGHLFPSGAKLHSHMHDALKWAMALCTNPGIKSEQGAIAYRVVAKFTYPELEDAVKAKNKSLVSEKYDKVKEYCEKAVSLGDYTMLPLHLQASGLVGDTKSQEAMYSRYINDPQLWKKTASALPFAREVMTNMPHHTREVIVEKVLPNLASMFIDTLAPEGMTNFLRDLSDLANLLHIHLDDYKAYGFKSKSEMKDVQLRAVSSYMISEAERCVAAKSVAAGKRAAKD